MDEAERRRRQDPRQPREEDQVRPRLGREDEGAVRRGRRRPVRLRLVLAGGEGRQDRGDEDAERREPAGARRRADPRLRRLGAFLLHRLPQPPARLPQGLRRSPGELGARRADARGRGRQGLARGVSRDTSAPRPSVVARIERSGMRGNPPGFRWRSIRATRYLQLGRCSALTPTWTMRGLSIPATPTYLNTRSSISRLRAR